MKNLNLKLKKIIVYTITVCLIFHSCPYSSNAQIFLSPPGSARFLTTLEGFNLTTIILPDGQGPTSPTHADSPLLPFILAGIAGLVWAATRGSVNIFPEWSGIAARAGTIVLSLWGIWESISILFNKRFPRVSLEFAAEEILRKNWDELKEEKKYEFWQLKGSPSLPQVRIAGPKELGFLQRARYISNTIIIHPSFASSRSVLLHEISHWLNDTEESHNGFWNRLYYFTLGWMQREEYARLYAWNISPLYYWRKAAAAAMLTGAIIIGFLILIKTNVSQNILQIPISDELLSHATWKNIGVFFGTALAIWSYTKSSEQQKIARRESKAREALILRMTELNEAARRTGLVMTYANRVTALLGKNGNDGFLEYMREEIDKKAKGEIIFIATSVIVDILRGEKSKSNITKDEQDQLKKLGREMKKIIGDAKRSGCSLKFLLAYPTYAITEAQEDHEKKEPGYIIKDLEKTTNKLAKWGIDKNNIRFFTKDVLSIFMIILPEHLLENPSTLVGNGSEHQCFMFENIGKDDSPYAQYRKDNFEQIWDSEDVISLEQFEAERGQLCAEINKKLAQSRQKNIVERAHIIKDIIPNHDRLEYATLRRALEEIIANPSAFNGNNKRGKKELLALLNINERTILEIVFTNSMQPAREQTARRQLPRRDPCTASAQ